MAENKYLDYVPDSHRLICKNDWNLAHLIELSKVVPQIKIPADKSIAIDGENVTNLDSAGAWFLIQLKNKIENKGAQVQLKNFSTEQMHLISLVESEKITDIPPKKELPFVPKVGKYFVEQINTFINFLSFTGMLAMETLRLGIRPSHWRLPAVTNVIYRTGFLALPIIALLSFMIGVVITYQMGLQLKNYGANIYIVDLLGLAILREFGPLLTAIMVAGRTGSSFTAQLGMMKVNQEIDALNTMGVTPAELLLLPRIFGLLITLPLLTIWADFFGVLGGMIMSNSMLSITPADFLNRFPHVIKLKNLFIGLGKAPVFALIIASIGCYQGMRVGTSADSVGRNTTRSVVLSIFFIIVADAMFSILFSKLKL